MKTPTSQILAVIAFVSCSGAVAVEKPNALFIMSVDHMPLSDSQTAPLASNTAELANGGRGSIYSSAVATILRFRECRGGA